MQIDPFTVVKQGQTRTRRCARCHGNDVGGYRCTRYRDGARNFNIERITRHIPTRSELRSRIHRLPNKTLGSSRCGGGCGALPCTGKSCIRTSHRIAERTIFGIGAVRDTRRQRFGRNHRAIGRSEREIHFIRITIFHKGGKNRFGVDARRQNGTHGVCGGGR